MNLLKSPKALHIYSVLAEFAQGLLLNLGSKKYTKEKTKKLILNDRQY